MKTKFILLIFFMVTLILTVPLSAFAANSGMKDKSTPPHLVKTGNPPTETTYWLHKFLEINITDVLLAIFTALLWFSTHRLWKSTEKLWESSKTQAADMQKSLIIGERAAEASTEMAKAAQLTAKAAINVELPFLNVEKVHETTLFNKDYDGWLSQFTPEITLKNYGRTPAFIKEVLINVAIAPRLDAKPSYTRRNKYPKAIVCVEGGAVTHREQSYYKKKEFNDIQIADLKIDKNALFVFGRITFSDFLGNVYHKGFIFSWINGEDRFLNLGDIYTEYDYQVLAM